MMRKCRESLTTARVHLGTGISGALDRSRRSVHSICNQRVSTDMHVVTKNPLQHLDARLTSKVLFLA